MALFTVKVKLETTMVVVAADEHDAYWVARDKCRDALDDERPDPVISIRGEVNSVRDLRDGWEELSVPYGGDGKRRIAEILESR